MKTDLIDQPQVSGELTEEEKKAISKEIETVVRNFMDAKTLSYQTEMELRANSEGTVFGGDGKIQAKGYDEIDDYLRKGFAEVQNFTEFEILSLYPYVLCRDAAVCTTLFKGKYLTTSGDTVTCNGCWTFVFKKFGNEWKVVQENGTHTS